MKHLLKTSFSYALVLFAPAMLGGCGQYRTGDLNLSQEGQPVVIHRNSTAAFSPTSSKGEYGGCGRLYDIRIWDGHSEYYYGGRNLIFTLDTVPQLNQQYLLTPIPGVGNAPIENAAGLTMHSDINGSPYNNDVLNWGVLTFQSVSSRNIAFSFLMVYADGKVLSGTVNQPLVPGPSSGCM